MDSDNDTTASQRTAARVLIVDDDRRMNALLTKYLSGFGFSVRAVEHPEAAFRALKADAPDLVILDIMLPELDGLAVCRRIRETSRIPIVMLTARGEVSDRIIGLEFGADDYLPKPFEPRELVARIQAVLRRGALPAEDTIRVGPIEISGTTRSASLKGRPLALTPAEFEILGLLVRNRGRVLSRDRLMEAIHGFDGDTYDRSIDVLVSRLRQKLGDDAKRSRFIRTVRGIGYSFTGEVGGE